MAAHSYRADAPPSDLVRALGWVVAVGGACAALGAVRTLDQPEGWLGLAMALVVVATTLMDGVAPGIVAAILGAVLTPVVLDTGSAPETALAVGLGGSIVALVLAATVELRRREGLRAGWLERLGALSEELKVAASQEDHVAMIEAARRRALGEAEVPPPPPLVAEHEAFLRSVGDQCAAALEHALLLEAERQSARDLELLAKATTALSASLDIERVAATLRELLVPYLADECDLVVVPLGGRSAPVAGPSPGDDPSTTVVLLRDRGEVIGRLRLARQDRPLTAAEEGAAELVAEPASRALAHAVAFSEQVRTSATLEHSLLPDAILPVPDLEIATRYLPATEGHAAGGDFYDVLQAPGGGAVLVVGDVQGKGVEAATLTSAARHTLRAAALDGAGPGDMLRRLNTALLYAHAERLQAVGEATVRFVTASVVALRPRDTGFTAVVASGGHPPPVLVRPGGGVEQLVVEGPLLGVFDDHCYEERTTELGLSDILVLYTDGVTEQRQQPVPFDEAQLGRLVRNMLTARHADAVAQAILDTVVAVSPREVRDDIALVVARVVGPR